MKRSPSLVKRLWLASLIILPIVIGFSSYALNRAYARGLDSAEYEALLSQIYALLAIAEPHAEGIMMPEVMANPRFETPESGLYAQVLDANASSVWQTNSLISSPIEFNEHSPPQPGNVRENWFSVARAQYRSLIFTTIWEVDGKDQTFSFEVIHEQSEKQQEIAQYQRSLLSWLSGMSLILLIFQIGITLWGLRPLKVLAKEIKQIEEGSSQQLARRYPVEIEPVTESLNKLLESESRQRDRYKNSLSDLAHSLKTPLSVIRSQLSDNEQGRAVDDQIKRMSEIINHQLRRASAEVKAIYGPTTLLLPIVTRLVNALNKVYRDKNMRISIDIDAEIEVSMSEDDCMEILGNIIENAYKYGDSEVQVTAKKAPDATELEITDDGPGVDEKLSNSVLERGARADTSKSGQGIGLAIAVDILSSYNGGLAIARSDSGGAKFQITIPS